MSKIIKNNNNIRLIRTLSWEEVFTFWYESEGKRESWINLAKKRGFASWAHWRVQAYAEPFECRFAEWGLYEISNPVKVISGFYGGPFRTWIKKYYDQEETKSFSELAHHPDIVNDTAIIQMANNFPSHSTIICLAVDDKIFTIEGSHRSCALAMMHAKNIEFNEKITIAIGKSKLNKLPVVGQVDPNNNII